MYAKTIDYIDFLGVSHTETFHFNLTKSELALMDFSTAGGMRERLDRVVKANDRPALIAEFRAIVKASYGVKSDDGKRFMKSDEIFRAFEESPAYDKFFIELISNSEASAEFANGVLPEDLVEEVKNQGENVAALPKN